MAPSSLLIPARETKTKTEKGGNDEAHLAKEIFVWVIEKLVQGKVKPRSQWENKDSSNGLDKSERSPWPLRPKLPSALLHAKRTKRKHTLSSVNMLRSGNHFSLFDTDISAFDVVLTEGKIDRLPKEPKKEVLSIFLIYYRLLHTNT
ncbi:hypothetical protein CDAR_320201 [Caerostris darwini]|uniref:Uncharacterized protein n=1 Tax=Caerostris darwini TaxID=1538125 RepID=A0AAV4PFH1_9ARAC|nr:hypothetical protein CDAR_320201 [Caerostris darwini]